MTDAMITLTKEQRDEALAIRRAEELADSKKYASQRFGIKPEDVLDYNSGCCYSKVWVNSREIAEQVRAKVKDREVNGGMFHGMGLGAITEESPGVWEVMV